MTTSAEIIYRQRLRLVDLAEELDDISEACCQIGVSRTRYRQSKHLAEPYRLKAVWHGDCRRPTLRNEALTLVVADLMVWVVVEPTTGRCQYADRLAELGFEISESAVQRILIDLTVGRRRQHIARATAIAMLSCPVTDSVMDSEPIGFCHWAGRPAISSLWTASASVSPKGRGKGYELTAISRSTRWAIVNVIVGPAVTGDTIRFIDHVRKRMRRLGIPNDRLGRPTNNPHSPSQIARHTFEVPLTCHLLILGVAQLQGMPS